MCYIEYKCPPRAPVETLISIFERDIQPFEQQHNVQIQVTCDPQQGTLRLTFERASHISLFLISHKPRSYTTNWNRVFNVHTV